MPLPTTGPISLSAVAAEIGRAAGSASFTWDGKDTSGTLVPTGTYTFKASAPINGTATDLALGEFPALGGIIPRGGRGAGHVGDHFHLLVGRLGALGVAATEGADQRHVAVEDQRRDAGLLAERELDRGREGGAAHADDPKKIAANKAATDKKPLAMKNTETQNPSRARV